MFRFIISKNLKNSIFVKTQLCVMLDPLDPNEDHFKKKQIIKNPNYTDRFVSNNPNNSIFHEIIHRVVLDSLPIKETGSKSRYKIHLNNSRL